MPIAIVMQEVMNTEFFALLEMMQACDSLFPIGQFTLSNGLESFVLEERLSNAKQLEQYVEGFMAIASYNDVLLLLLAYEAGSEQLLSIDEIAFASKTPMEIRTGSQRLSKRFIGTWEGIAGAKYPGLMKYKELVESGSCKGIFPISVGVYARDIGIDKEKAAALFLYSQLSGIVTNAVKTIPLSQKDGQRVLNRALEAIPQVVKKSLELTIEDLGVGGAMYDIEGMRHEDLYSRQYMS